MRSVANRAEYSPDLVASRSPRTKPDLKLVPTDSYRAAEEAQRDRAELDLERIELRVGGLSHKAAEHAIPRRPINKTVGTPDLAYLGKVTDQLERKVEARETPERIANQAREIMQRRKAEAHLKQVEARAENKITPDEMVAEAHNRRQEDRFQEGDIDMQLKKIISRAEDSVSPDEMAAAAHNRRVEDLRADKDISPDLERIQLRARGLSHEAVELAVPRNPMEKTIGTPDIGYLDAVTDKFEAKANRHSFANTFTSDDYLASLEKRVRPLGAIPPKPSEKILADSAANELRLRAKRAEAAYQEVQNKVLSDAEKGELREKMRAAKRPAGEAAPAPALTVKEKKRQEVNAAGKQAVAGFAESAPRPNRIEVVRPAIIVEDLSEQTQNVVLPDAAQQMALQKMRKRGFVRAGLLTAALAVGSLAGKAWEFFGGEKKAAAHLKQPEKNLAITDAQAKQDRLRDLAWTQEADRDLAPRAAAPAELSGTHYVNAPSAEGVYSAEAEQASLSAAREEAAALLPRSTGAVVERPAATRDVRRAAAPDTRAAVEASSVEIKWGKGEASPHEQQALLNMVSTALGRELQGDPRVKEKAVVIAAEVVQIVQQMREIRLAKKIDGIVKVDSLSFSYKELAQGIKIGDHAIRFEPGAMSKILGPLKTHVDTLNFKHSPADRYAATYGKQAASKKGYGLDAFKGLGK